MNLLLAVDNSLYVPAWVAFFVVMTIIGFCIMRLDKKRFDLQKARSDQMMAPRKKAGDPDEEVPEDGKKKKKGKKRAKEEVPEDYEYQDRVPNGALIAVAILLGGVGELLAMLIYRHKWYKWAFRTFIPILAVFNLAVFGLLLYVILEMGAGNALTNIV